jgi:hypothetical protein
MPARNRSADDPPKRTPCFVCEVPLRVSAAQERALLTRLEAARQVYNACLGEAHTRARLVRESKAIENQRASGQHPLSSFGQSPGGDPSQSASPATGRPANAESRDAVAKRQRKARARQRRR